MGPLAGIGDSLIGGTLRVIATGIVAGLCMSGSLLGPILFLLIYNIPTILLRYFGVKFGYGLGNTLISKLSEGDLMKKLTMAMGNRGIDGNWCDGSDDCRGNDTDRVQYQ